MLPTNSISAFIHLNDSELRAMIYHFCETIQYPEPVDDVVQDFYLKILTSRIIQSYNPNWSNEVCRNVKMSTYMYPIIKNFVMGKLKSQGYKYLVRKVWDGDEKDEENPDEIDTVIKNRVSPEYLPVLNNKTENVDGLETDLRLFQENFRKSRFNLTYSLNKRGNKQIKRKCTLFKIFQLLYKGYNNREIAKLFGVSNMTITILKSDLAKALQHHGFKPFVKNKIIPLLSPKPALNGHKKEKTRSLNAFEKNLIQKWFVKLNGIVLTDSALNLKKMLGPDIKIFQITGFITHLHGQVKRGEITLHDRPQYEKDRAMRRALWASYKSPKYAKLNK